MNRITRDDLSNFIQWYEELTPRSLADIESFYHQDAYFKDPFHEFNGVAGIKYIFEHMFENTKSPAFHITNSVFDEENQTAFLIWDFIFKIGNGQYKIHGSTFLQFEDRKVKRHRDYWDVGEEVLAKIPAIRFFYKCLTKRFNVYEAV